MTTSSAITINLAERSYPVYIGAGLLQTIHWQQHIIGRQVLIVSNPIVATHHLAALEKNLAAYQREIILLPDGEAYKTLDSFSQIIDRLVELNFNRQCTLIALGGGVIGDITGFAASCYQRGVNFIQIPTTLLSQVDASVGGKTAVNHTQGKNLIGAFHQPQCVIIDTNTLSTLPEREFRAGLAEIIKHALIADPNYLTDIETHLDLLLAKDEATLARIIRRSCEIKADIVSRDEKETKGDRLLLNFGHTFAHAIETLTHYETYLHGEAVAIGMVCAAELSRELGYLSDAEVNRVTQLINKVGLPTSLPDTLSKQQLTALFSHDKKARDDGVQFIVLESLGKAVVKNIN